MRSKAFSVLLFAVLLAVSIVANSCSLTKPPKKPWNEATLPLAPDYAQLKYWAAHPGKLDSADCTPNHSLKDRQQEALVDVFFLHPTLYFGGQNWNGDTDDEKLNNKIDGSTIHKQASIFNGVGRVYAPRYRQMVLGGFWETEDLLSKKNAFDVAYSDLSRAFEYYLANENQGRPIIIASHSQGSAHAIRLLKEFFDGKPLQDQLVAAYAVGWPVKKDTFSTILPCGSPEATGCFASWCSFEWGSEPKNPEWYQNAVCINPVTWKRDTLPSDQNEHLGTVMGKFNEIHSEATNVQVHGGYLWVKRPKVKGTSVIPGNNFHIADYNLFWMDVRENAQLRTNTYLQKKSKASH
jgi:hypothetical protein